ncbi:hypothetical protein BD413DRAFT_508416 [Trametes elegans]|nr:hypothetical protein BD413DRAFT_508416 [Trametes elegans]
MPGKCLRCTISSMRTLKQPCSLRSRSMPPPGPRSVVGRLAYLVPNRPLTTPPAALEEIDEDMPPDYELQSYWKERFDGEHHFEWLGDGKDTILPHVRSYLRTSLSPAHPTPGSPPRLLHIGAGTSSLSERLRELYLDVYGADTDERAIVHTDFAENLVAREREAEEARRAKGGPEKGMRWFCLDVLRWTEVKALLDLAGPFEVVVDKSTSDAISCGEDVSYEGKDAAKHPAIDKYLTTHGGEKTTFAAVELLAIHLASVVRAGGLWVALTFSSNRFSFLSAIGKGDASSPRAMDYWNLERVIAVEAPSGTKSNVHAPVVQHYVCLIRRKGAIS